MFTSSKLGLSFIWFSAGSIKWVEQDFGVINLAETSLMMTQKNVSLSLSGTAEFGDTSSLSVSYDFAP